MPSMGQVSLAALVLASSAPRVSRADQLGYDMGVGPVVVSHGALADAFEPALTARFEIVGYRGDWAIAAGIAVLNELGSNGRDAFGEVLGLRRYATLGRGMRNGVRWKWAAFGGAGLMVAWLQPPQTDTADATAAARPAIVTATPSATMLWGPRLSAGIELALASRVVCSRVALVVTDQELTSGALSGGFATVELELGLAFGH
jgi:hypothetical protein